MENFQIVVEDLLKASENAQAQDKKKLARRWNYTANVFKALDEKSVPPKGLDKHLKELRSLMSQEEVKAGQVTRYYTKLISFLQKNYGYVTQKYYQNQWLAIGMAAFGMPFGVMFGFALDNMAFLGIGLPIGMSIGIAIGTQKDKQAQAEGKQLNIVCDM